MQRKSVLGRGLSDLLNVDEVQTGGSSFINEIELSKIMVNPNQPRREFDEEALKELSKSIAEVGIIQPITLKKNEDDTYMVIAGERRFRASKLAGLTTIPAYIRTANDENIMEMALIENIQREDLNAMEIALAYQHLMDEYHLTQEQLSEKVGKKRATVANYLRMLKLPAAVQIGLKNRQIDMGHARALLTINDPQMQTVIFHEILEHGYSVRKVEELAKAINEGGGIRKEDPSNKSSKNHLSEEFGMLKKQLSNFFNTKVQLTCSDNGKGKISIAFDNEEELERIITIFDSMKQ